MENEKLKEELLAQIEGRKAEHAQYQMNIDNYKLLLEKLPSEWPPELLKFKGMNVESIVGAAKEGEDIYLAADLVLRDKIAVALKHEQLQQRVPTYLLEVLTERYNALEEDAQA